MMRFVNGISLRDFHPSERVPGSLRESITGPACISHGPGGGFAFDHRRAGTPDEFFRICRRHLDHDAPLPARPPEDSWLFPRFSKLLPAAATLS